MGTTQMFAALSDSSVNDFLHEKIELFIALAPIVYIVTFLTHKTDRTISKVK